MVVVVMIWSGLGVGGRLCRSPSVVVSQIVCGRVRKVGRLIGQLLFFASGRCRYVENLGKVVMIVVVIVLKRLG